MRHQRHPNLAWLVTLLAAFAMPTFAIGSPKMSPFHAFRMATHEVENEYAGIFGSPPFLASVSRVARVIESGVTSAPTTSSLYGITSLTRNASGTLFAATGSSLNPITLGSRNIIAVIQEAGSVLSAQPFTKNGQPAAFAAPPDLVNLVGIAFDPYTDNLFAAYESSTASDRIIRINSDGSSTPIGTFPPLLPPLPPGLPNEAGRVHGFTVRCDGLLFAISHAKVIGESFTPALYVFDLTAGPNPIHAIILDANDLPPLNSSRALMGSVGDLHFDRNGTLWLVDGGLSQTFFQPSLTISQIHYDLSANSGTIIVTGSFSDPEVPSGFSALTSLGCPGDVNDDGAVDSTDLNALLTAWGSSGRCLAGDLDFNGVVNASDLNAILSNFGNTCD